ncbi:MAG: alpha/beta fold hydrolase [Nocardioidaceae bacterium]
MKTVPLPFFSNGLRLDADLHLPDEPAPDGGYPVVVPASGFQGLKVIHPERFARALTVRGYAVIAFDYRGFGASEGERGRLVPQEWVEDLRAAVDTVASHPAIDAERISLLGWALGGGVVVAEAATDPRVKAVAVFNGISSGFRSTRKMHDDASWQSLLDRLPGDRARRTATGRSEVTSPWDIVRLDLDNRTDVYVEDVLYRAPGFGSGVTLESAEYLLRFEPGNVVHQIDRPILIVHGRENELHKAEEAVELYERATEPKELILLDGHGHTEWMFDDNPTFKSLMEKVDELFGSATRELAGS